MRAWCGGGSDDSGVEHDSDSEVEESIALTPEEIAASTCLGRFESQGLWPTFILGVIALNTVVLAIEADYAAANPDGAGPPFYHWLDEVLLGIFVVEITLRLTVYGCGFFCNSSRLWNCFDFCIVASGVVDQWILPFVVSDTNEHMSTMITISRSLRVLRVLRAVRVMKQLSALNQLLLGLLNSVRSVFWIATMFIFLIFTSSIFITNMVGTDPDVLNKFADPAQVKEWFGSIGNSMITLSIYLTSDDWATSARMINEQYPLMEAFWVWYVVMGAFLLISLLTGLMVERMMDAREEQVEKKETPDPEALDKLLKKMQRRMSCGEVMDYNVFTELFKAPEMQVPLAQCGLEVNDDDGHQIMWLFKSFDRDGSKRLSWGELREAFLQISRHARVQGKACVLEVMKLEGRMTRLDRILTEVDAGQTKENTWDHRIEVIQGRAALLHEKAGALQADLNELFLKMRITV